MRYMGSKGRHAKHIIPHIMKYYTEGKKYIEPFVGGANLFHLVPVDDKEGYDTAELAIAVLTAVRDGWVPPKTLSFQEYVHIRDNPERYPKEMVGFAGHCCTYGGKLWGGYARNTRLEGDHSTVPASQHRALLKQKEGLQNSILKVMDYRNVQYSAGSVVYMDPPYANTTGYGTGGFDHDEFWDFCKYLSTYCTVLVSEYNAPEGWEILWSKDTVSHLDNKSGKKENQERLFKLKQ